MGIVSTAEFQRLLAGLNSDDLMEFMPDLWAAQGQETHINDRVIVLTGPTTGERERVAVATRRFGRWTASDRVVDRVVAPYDVAGARRLAAENDAAFVGPAAIKNLALYGVNRKDCEEIFSNYFNRGPTELAFKRSQPVWVRTSVLGTTPLVMLLVLAVVLGFSMSTGTEPPAFARTATPNETTSSGRHSVATATDTPSAGRQGAVSFPASINDEGSSMPRALPPRTRWSQTITLIGWKSFVKCPARLPLRMRHVWRRGVGPFK
jgi:hypothetical protein